MESNLRATRPLLHFGILISFYALGAITLFSHTALHALSGNTHASRSTAEYSACPSTPSRSHTLTFTDTGTSPRSLTVERCDEITIKNETSENMTAALGEHSHHAHYPGFEEKVLAPGHSYTFMAKEAGAFPLHDHDKAFLSTTLTVKN